MIVSRSGGNGMNREIVFRGKDVKSGRWEFGYFTECVEPMDEPVVLSYITDIENNSFIVYRETVSQYTGLKDSTGKRIFEGDIVKVRDPYSGCWSVNGGEVIFSTEYVGGWVLTSNGKDGLNIGTRTNNIKIIGNIHDNPELLEVQEWK
jgi:uncharacterized phage protein (TIGR01671 family)